MNKTKSNLHVKKVRKGNEQKKQIKAQRNQIIKQNLTSVNLVIGIDNGTTGTMCSWIIQKGICDFIQTPSYRTLNYQKEINYIDRLQHKKFKEWLNLQIKNAKRVYKNEIKVIIILQRPMVNPQRFESSLLAVRAFESALVILQQLNLNYIVIDSKQWQHYFFGKETTFINLKYESLKKGLNIINEENVNYLKEIIIKHGDADALLITKFAIEKLIKK